MHLRHTFFLLKKRPYHKNLSAKKEIGFSSPEKKSQTP
jgi:hypothetical protein